MNRNFIIAFIRTSLVPPMAGFILAWLVKHGISIQAAWVTSLLVIALSGIYYVIFHMVEVLSKNPRVQKWAGIFLGYPKQPTYTKDPVK